MDANERKHLRLKNWLKYFILVFQVNQLADQFKYLDIVYIFSCDFHQFKGWFHGSTRCNIIPLLWAIGNPKRTDGICEKFFSERFPVIRKNTAEKVVFLINTPFARINFQTPFNLFVNYKPLGCE